MRAAATLNYQRVFDGPYSCYCPSTPPPSLPFTRRRQLNLPNIHFNSLKCKPTALRGDSTVAAASLSSWDDEPYEVLPNGKIAYLDEQDVVTFLDPPKELIPLDPSSYNPAAYL